ncbi:hypothetical protein AB205_0075320 [Aquarana catesbeiana]|uniref:Uncharacterized protein n=1 Tax=Aquarana catesbeiana TaxID=8400 RepID=A0A2G9PDG5_AQUCT|nr:hypothetical protein AB205_0075320 [Aquarana catesbeiana]
MCIHMEGVSRAIDGVSRAVEGVSSFYYYYFIYSFLQFYYFCFTIFLEAPLGTRLCIRLTLTNRGRQQEVRRNLPLGKEIHSCKSYHGKKMSPLKLYYQSLFPQQPNIFIIQLSHGQNMR